MVYVIPPHILVFTLLVTPGDHVYAYTAQETPVSVAEPSQHREQLGGVTFIVIVTAQYCAFKKYVEAKRKNKQMYFMTILFIVNIN